MRWTYDGVRNVRVTQDRGLLTQVVTYCDSGGDTKSPELGSNGSCFQTRCVGNQPCIDAGNPSVKTEILTALKKEADESEAILKDATPKCGKGKGDVAQCRRVYCLVPSQDQSAILKSICARKKEFKCTEKAKKSDEEARGFYRQHPGGWSAQCGDSWAAFFDEEEAKAMEVVPL